MLPNREKMETVVVYCSVSHAHEVHLTVTVFNSPSRWKTPIIPQAKEKKQEKTKTKKNENMFPQTSLSHSRQLLHSNHNEQEDTDLLFSFSLLFCSLIG